MPGLVGEELARIESSQTFSKVPSQARLLRFLVEQGSEPGRLKEAYIGAVFFGRDASYDPRYDSIVRVNINRLRQRLAEYYAGEGAANPVILSIPKGSYQPVSRLREQVQSEADTGNEQLSGSASSGSSQVVPAVSTESDGRKTMVVTTPPQITTDHPELTPLSPRWNLRLTLVLCAVAAILLAAILLKTKGWDTPTVAVLPLANLSEKPENEWLSVAMQQSIASGLEGAKVIAGQQAANAAHDLGLHPAQPVDPNQLTSLHQRLGVRYIVSGTYAILEDRIRFDLQLQDAVSGTKIATYQKETTRQDIFPALADTAAQLRKALHLEPVSSSKQEGSADFKINYTTGLRQLQSDEYSAAQISLSQALKADPHSPAAHVALASVWQQMGFDDQAAAEAASALSYVNTLTGEERLRVEAKAYECLSQWNESLSLYSQLLQSSPDNLDYALDRARVLTASGHATEALDALRAVHSRSQAAAHDARVALAEAQAAKELNDQQSALVYAGEAVRLARASSSRHLEALALVREGWAWSYLANDAKAVEIGKEAVRISEEIGNYSDLGISLAEVGQVQRSQGDPGAEGTMLRALELVSRTGTRAPMISLLIGLGNIRQDAEDIAGAKRYFLQALQLAMESHRPNYLLPAAGSLAELELQEDDNKAAREYATRVVAAASPAHELENLNIAIEILGEVDAREGRVAEARIQFNKALAFAVQSSNHDREGFILLNLALLEAHAGHLAVARGLLDRVAKLQRANRDLAVAQTLADAEISLLQGRAKATVPALLQLTVNPKGLIYPATVAWRLLGEAYLSAGELHGARTAMEKSLALAQRSPNTTEYLMPTLLLKAKLDLAEGHKAEAAKTLTNVLARATKVNANEVKEEAQALAARA